MRPLGSTQREVLRTLEERNSGRWFPGCGWVWGTVGQTRRLLDSLVKRGLVEVTGPLSEYGITDAGRRASRADPTYLGLAYHIEIEHERELAPPMLDYAHLYALHRDMHRDRDDWGHTHPHGGWKEVVWS